MDNIRILGAKTQLLHMNIVWSINILITFGAVYNVCSVF